jgi:3-hydroxybutyryl-CoA dehydrogenase
MKNIAVIGSGTMGNGIAHLFAQYGYTVSLIDISAEALEKAKATISKNLDRMIAKEKITVEVKEKTLQNIRSFTSLDEGVKDCDLVIEAATENVEMKCKIFSDMDKAAKPGAILASNTSSISITKLAAYTQRPDRVIGMHFMNPVPMMKLVEVIRGFETSQEVTDTIITLSKKLDKVPAAVFDYPGFVSNRILMPLINEAIYTLYEDVAGVEEIDTIMKLGMSHPMGPLQLADFIGLDVCLAILNVLYTGFGNTKYAPCPLLVKMVTARQLGVKTGKGFYDYSHGTKELIVNPKLKKLGE